MTKEEVHSQGAKPTLIEPGPADTKMRRDFHKDDMSRLAQPEDIADLVMFVVTQPPKIHTTVLSLFTATNPEIEMRPHWEEG